MEIRELIEKIVKEMEEKGGLKNVVWVAAGGSNDGHYAAQYFMDRESTAVRSQMITSSEFEFAAPKCIGENTIAVITSMRGTKETIEAAKVAKELGAVTISQYVDESGLTEVCDYNVQYGSIWEDDEDQGRTNAGNALRIAMAIVDVTEGYKNYADAMDAFEKIQPAYVRAREYCRPLAKKWADQVKDEKTITVIASGPAYGSGHIFQLVIFSKCYRFNLQHLTVVIFSMDHLKLQIKMEHFSSLLQMEEPEKLMSVQLHF